MSNKLVFEKDKKMTVSYSHVRFGYAHPVSTMNVKSQGANKSLQTASGTNDGFHSVRQQARFEGSTAAIAASNF